MVLAQPFLERWAFDVLTEFPSHYGSRSTDLWAALKPWFNKVSIPLWFSLNSVPYWPRQKSLVSIPLWFSLNFLDCARPVLIPLGFHPTMVLAQQTDNFVGFKLSSCFHPTMVLAQPRNWLGVNPSEPFPSHYGSRSTRSWRQRLQATERFPSHYGSRSTRLLKQWEFSRTAVFPSHYGSRSTHLQGYSHK